MRFGLIGCGGIGQLRADALSKMTDQRLAAVSDVDLNRGAEFSARYSADQVADWREMIDRDDIDAVIVSTPPSLHAEMCIASLEAGKHVLCEKPLTRTIEEANTVLAASEANGRTLATGFNYRFYPSIVKAREIFNSGLIGELDHIRSYTGYTAQDHNHDWLHDVNVMGGGSLRDNGIHLIDLTLYFLGDAAEVKGYASEAVWNYKGCEDNGFALIRNSKGNIATLQASWTEWNGYRFVIDIYGTRGAIHASCFPMLTQVTWFSTLGDKPKRKSYQFPKVFVMEHLRSYRWVVVQSFIEEFKAFSNLVSGNKNAAIATVQDGYRAIEVAYSATVS